MDNADDSDQRYTAFQFSHTFGGEVQWGVEDHGYLPAEIIRGWRKGNLNRPWRGTEDAARHLARLLSDNSGDVDFVAKGELSKSQMIFYSNLAKKRSRLRIGNQGRATALSKPSVKFRKCDKCGRMTKSDNHCG